jgi:hypothetical protein
MADQQECSELRELLDGLKVDADLYFGKAAQALEGVELSWPVRSAARRDLYWQELPYEIRGDATRLDRRLVSVIGQIARGMRNAPLISEADQRDVTTGAKAMRAALLLREFRSWDTEVLHDEGTVLGVTRAGQSDDEPVAPDAEILDLIAASPAPGYSGDGTPTETARYRPGTAFIMMWMDKVETRPRRRFRCGETGLCAIWHRSYQG